MTYRGTLAVAFLSEWHCGTGAGRHGGVDRTVGLDDEGLPYVPGRTLKGLWRDACERAAHALDDGKPGEWSRLVRNLFGDPALSAHGPGASRGLVHVRDGRLTAAWRERLLGDESDVLVPGLRVTRAGVAISDVTGTARPDHLRLVEFARGGLDVEAPFSIEAPKHWAIDLILGAGLQDVRAVGAHRRRGAGRCRITTESLSDPARIASEHASEVVSWRLDSLPLRPQHPAQALAPAVASRNDLVHAGRVVLTTRQPVVVSRAVLGNLMLSHDFVPGASLLPLVAQALGPMSADLIRAGQLVVTDAVPTPGTARLARTPLCLVSGEKGSGWLTDGDDAHDLREGVRQPSDRPVGGWALRRSHGAWRILRPGVTNTAHASIDDSSQRTLENGVYTLQAIPVGARLAFDVWLPEDLEGRLDALPKQAAIGRYRQDGHGLVDVEVLAPPATDVIADVDADSIMSLWLTSDACIEEIPGIPATTPQAFARALEAALGSRGVRTTLTIDEDRTFAAVARRDSWSGSVSLPRATLTGLSAGSVLTLRTSLPISGAELRRVLDRGIGERRSEGFGRCEPLPVAGVQGIAPWSSDPTPAPSVGGTPGQAAPERWADVRRAVWRDEIQQRIKVAVTEPSVRGEFLARSVSVSNLGTLRTAAMALPVDAGAVDRWLEATLEHDDRGEYWAEVADSVRRHFGSASLRGPAALRAWFTRHQTASLREMADDLGGHAPQQVASWLLTECVRRQTLATQIASGRES